MNVFSAGSDLLFGEAMKGLGDELKVIIKVAWALLSNHRPEKTWVTVGAHKRSCRSHPVTTYAEELFSPQNSLA